MNYILKYEVNTYKLLGIFKKKYDSKIGYIKDDKAVYIPCISKEDAIRTYRSILREKINEKKKQKKILNQQIINIKNLLLEVENEK